MKRKGVLACIALCTLLSFSACRGGSLPSSENAEAAAEGSVEVNMEESLYGTCDAFREKNTPVIETENYAVYELPFERDGMKIYGRLYLPVANMEKYPLIAIGHGFQGSYSYSAAYAEYFADAGIAAYIFDFCGGSTFSESDGSMKDMSVLTEREDFETVFDSLRSLSFADREHTFLMGESQGGMVAALLASKRADDVAGLVLFYPALVIPDDARRYYTDKEHIPDSPRALGTSVGRQYFLDVINMDVYEEIGGYDGEVFIAHGDADGTVPISYSEQAKEVYQNAELLVISGAGHGFYGSQLQEACENAVTFVKRLIAD